MLYTPVKLALADDQMEKLKGKHNPIGNGKKFLSIKIQLQSKHGQPMVGQHTLLLTRGQIAHIEKVRMNGLRRFKTIRMSKHQVEKNLSHSGGILGFLAGLASKALPILAKGVATGLLSGAVEGFGKGGDGLYLFKRGHCIKVDAVEGNGLYLRAHPSSNGTLGDGLYLKRGNNIHNGEGLLFGKNSPIKKIPILGDLLGWLL